MTQTSSTGWFPAQMTTTIRARLGKAEIGALYLQAGLLHEVTLLHCSPRDISRELHQRQNSWDSNWHSVKGVLPYHTYEGMTACLSV